MKSDAAPGVMTHISDAGKTAAAKNPSDVAQTPSSSNMPKILGYVAGGAATLYGAYKIASYVNSWVPEGTKNEYYEWQASYQASRN